MAGRHRAPLSVNGGYDLDRTYEEAVEHAREAYDYWLERDWLRVQAEAALSTAQSNLVLAGQNAVMLEQNAVIAELLARLTGAQARV